MTRLLIQPAAYPEAKRNRGKTLHNDVRFRDLRSWSALSEAQRAELDDLHPNGRARFWGTRSFLDHAMERVTTGDVALFAWQNHIRAIGEVGASFRDGRFADELWRESETEDSFVNVYSLSTLHEELKIPYGDLADASDGALVGPFRQGRVIEDAELVRRVLDGLGIQTSSAEAAEAERDDYVLTQLERGLAVKLESFLTREVTYERSARSIKVRRAESLLVHEYAEAHPDRVFERIRSTSGITDMYTLGPDGAEVIEAKGGVTRERVRQAVAQLLHYAPRCEDHVARLTALFPARPDDDGIKLLHSVGIDCVYRREPGRFERLPAPAARRLHMIPVWNDDVPE